MLVGGMAGTKTYVDDVFSAYTYTGNGATQTITNGIDLSGKGGLVWTKARDIANGHALYDTLTGVNSRLQSHTTAALGSTTGDFTSFSNTGYTVGAPTVTNELNQNTKSFVSWTFRKAPKFFDVQTATLSSGNATVSFANLATLGMVIVKRTDSTGSWYVWHRSLTAGKLLYLEQTAAEATLGHITVSGTTLTLVDGTLADGDYVCYGFAHDTTTDGIIQCGSYTGTGAGNIAVTLGWEPQFVMVKRATVDTGSWMMSDSMRGMPANATPDNVLIANTSGVENAIGGVGATATGFKVSGGGTANYDVNGSVYIYLAIRRPNKPPTLGTQVYNAVARTGTGAAATVTGVGFAPDLVTTFARAYGSGFGWIDKLRGWKPILSSYQTVAEDNTYSDVVTAFGMDGISVGADTGSTFINSNTKPYITYFFRRAVGVFDQVCYTGTGVAKTEAHNLGEVPELMIVKSRSVGGNQWSVYSPDGATKSLELNSAAANDTSNVYWNNTAPTSSVFTVGTWSTTNESAATFVAYLFATKAGISKVGSYTGNGSNQTINCGFTTGARFVLIKRTDSTGDWFVWDSVRGIVAGDDPHLSLNTSAAEVTTDDSIDPDTSGFIVNQVAATNINVNAATYIFLSLA